MNYALLDTSVWLTLAPSNKLSELIDQIRDFVDSDQLVLLVPEIVKEEFSRNRESVLKSSVSSYQTYLKHARKLDVLLDDAEKSHLINILDKARAKIPDMQESISESLMKIESLFNNSKSVLLKFSESDEKEVVEKALKKKAPFHRNKNSVADGLIMLQFRNFTIENKRAEGDYFYFLSENKEDFSDAKDKSALHPDFEPIFADDNIVYSVLIGDVLNSISANIVTPEVEKDFQRAAAYYRNLCTDGGPHEVDHESGAWLRSQYGGLTWHMRCKKCGATFDTGEHWD